MRFELSRDVTNNQHESQAHDVENKSSETAYLLWFVPEGKDGEDDALLIGVYASELDAKEAILRLQNKPGFSGYVDGFHVCSYKVGRDHWTEGFVRK